MLYFIQKSKCRIILTELIYYILKEYLPRIPYDPQPSHPARNNKSPDFRQSF
ncbi:hypothetical protein HMPREF0765_4925, partial [Sphingobacterium spiritivorum ATCC 33300]